MALALWQLAFLIFPGIALLHLHISPYTKVEESFNIQAIHDILEYGVPLSKATTKFEQYFDHLEFPGAVPRTFIGSLWISGLASPVVWLAELTGKSAQNCVRGVLGVFNATALAWFARSVERAYGPIVATWYVVLQAAQFHVWYYASRTLPNMFAFFLSTLALSFLLPNPTSSLGPLRRSRLGLYLMTLATIIFRSELALLLLAHCLWMLLKAETMDAKVQLIRKAFVPAIMPGAIMGLILTVTIDSYFWRSSALLWPELSAFLSNVFPKGGEQGASAWGVQPFHWYLTSALPRLLMSQIFMLSPLSMSPPSLDNLIPGFLYMITYSILPHKELRFLFPIIPSLTLAAALTCTRLTINVQKSSLTKLLLYAVTGSTILTAFLSHVVLLPLSARNYAGGEALLALHEYHRTSWEVTAAGSRSLRGKPAIHVHLTNLALQSGVTRFLEQPLDIDASSQAAVSQSIVETDGGYIEKQEPLVLPGDEHHPALTIQPKINTPSPSPFPDSRISESSQWIYDKTSNATAFMEPSFWDHFDYVIVEYPSRAIGAWEIVQEINALGQPRLLKSDERGSDQRGTTVLIHAMYPAAIARPLSWMHDLAHGLIRDKILQGYWVEVAFEPKLYILKRSSLGTDPNRHEPPDVKKVPDGLSQPLYLSDSATNDQHPLGIASLGPLVVNKDGTLSRLDNWEQMTEPERKKTVQYLKKRNMLRVEEAEAAVI